MTIIEILSVIIGVISVYLTIKQNILCWVFGLISCSLLSYYFYNVHFYTQMTLQLVSVIQCIYGIIRWNKIDTKEVKSIGYKKSFTLIGMSILVGVGFTLLTNTTNNNWLYLDGVGGIVALVATYLLVMKVIESWWIFMINNIMLITLSIHSDMYYIAGFNLLLMIMSVFGYKEWKKELV